MEQDIWDAGFKLKIAIHNIQEQYFEGDSIAMYTSENPVIKNVLINILNNVNLIFLKVDCFNNTLEKYYPEKFQWNELKEEYRKRGCSMPARDSSSCDN